LQTVYYLCPGRPVGFTGVEGAFAPAGKGWGDLTVWYDGEILPGQEWEKAIKAELYSAYIILLLVTDKLLDSEYANLIEITSYKDCGLLAKK